MPKSPVKILIPYKKRVTKNEINAKQRYFL